MGAVDKVAGSLNLNAVVLWRILELVVVVSAAEEASVAFFAGLVVVVHVGSAAAAPGDGVGALLSKLEVGVHRADEAAHGGFVAVVEG